MQTVRPLVLASCVVALAASAALAASPGTPTVAPAGQPLSAALVLSWKPQAWRPPAAAAVQGMRIAIDPVTGQFEMPAPGAIESFARIGDDAPVRIDVRANGSRRATLDERFADFAVIRVSPDGLPQWTCVHGQGEAQKFVKAPILSNVPLPLPGTTWEVK